MGRSSRTPEAMENFNTLASMGYKVAGQIKAPGTLEGGRVVNESLSFGFTEKPILLRFSGWS